ncbi:hypothetical protein FQN54_008765 [Arachnomyces sp. PD_36]|nr:hypothetical protein FQN54_008765 [Arachnomyces sp. PD_36]
MYTKLLAAVVETLLVGSALATPTSTVSKRQSDIEAFIEKQRPVSLDGIVANIGPDGSGAQGAAAGIVVASPSKSDPDYFYTWTRDAGLTFKTLVEVLVAGDDSVKPQIDDYVTSQAKLQEVENPSGGIDSGGLGEPKFHVDMSAFTEEWGRPQRDGPALRATALMTYGTYLLENGGKEQAKSEIWPIVQKDLGYVTEYWQQTGFDLWEEVEGNSFFTVSGQHRALVEGVTFAEKIGETCEGCDEQAQQIVCSLEDFWNGEFIVSNMPASDRTGLDANSILASNHRYDPAASCSDSTFQPCSSRALSNHKAVVDSFRDVYGINSGIEAGKGVAIGRYSEDVYMGGNPWYLTTLAAAEQLYNALHQWETQGSITIDETSLAFFQDVSGDAAVGEIAAGDEAYKSITSAIKTYADSFVAVVQEYTPEDGSYAEQFGRDDGTPMSAADLTWSYAAFVAAVDRRAGENPPSWGETKSTCGGGGEPTGTSSPTPSPTASGAVRHAVKRNTNGVPVSF